MDSSYLFSPTQTQKIMVLLLLFHPRDSFSLSAHSLFFDALRISLNIHEIVLYIFPSHPIAFPLSPPLSHLPPRRPPYCTTHHSSHHHCFHDFPSENNDASLPCELSFSLARRRDSLKNVVLLPQITTTTTTPFPPLLPH